MSDLFGVQGRQFLTEAMETVRPAARRVLADNLTLVDHLTQQIQALENDLDLTPEQHQTVNLLKSMPGIGKINATIIAAEIGDISRFDSPKALCNWAGLTPRVRKSDRMVRHGRISKQGSAYLRGTMTRAASIASYKSKRWHNVHEKLVPRCSKKGAKVAVARRLLTVAYYMLKRNQPYQEDYSKPSPAVR